jgi:hypothetical protein
MVGCVLMGIGNTLDVFMIVCIVYFSETATLRARVFPVPASRITLR